ncbi:MAG: hypothetical protein Ct9H300mP13_0620 [Gammaproteobacteria bacterium]|nr:MAG: hypothetical protein Ct9H300mP13_0620 [Gammaproteobacteria bacterium]
MGVSPNPALSVAQYSGLAVDWESYGWQFGPSNGEKIGLGNGDAVNAVDEYIRIGPARSTMSILMWLESSVPEDAGPESAGTPGRKEWRAVRDGEWATDRERVGGRARWR